MTERKPQRGGRKESDKGRKPWTINSDDDSSDNKSKRKESSRSSKPPKKDDRPKRRQSDDDKPKRSTRSRDSYGEKSYGKKDSTRSRKSSDRDDDKPKRSYKSEDRPKRSYSDKDKPKRSYGDKDKPKRRYNDDDKPKRSYGDKDKPKRSYGDKDKPKRRFNDDDKPKRSYGDKDKPKRPYKSDDDKKRSFAGQDSGFDSYKGKKKENHSYISSYEPEDSRERKNRLKSTSTKPKSEPKLATETRLNKYIANSGVCSRREADTYIKAGLVSINGVIVTELGTKVMPGDEVRFNGELLRGEQKVYLLMNKPKGYVTTVEDPHADKTVMDIVKNYSGSRIYPVGRLDKNSTGVLLFTNDGELTLQLTHPSYNKKKIYQVKIDKPLTKNDMQRLVDGVELEDGLAYFDILEYANEERTEFGIEIHSGRNRIIRRMFEHLDYKVTKLDRVYFAGLTKKNLKRGECRFLNDKEVSVLKMGSYE